jgi:CheY-like chemotaxis protein
MNVVIADDNTVALKLLRNALLLLPAGHEVRPVVNGRQALDALNDGKCRLIIADWEMPEMDGLELCRAVRTAGLPDYIYFILCSPAAGQARKSGGAVRRSG